MYHRAFMLQQNVIRFNNSNRRFYLELKKRVDAYFQENSLSKTGDYRLYFKALFMLAVYATSYFMILFSVFDSKLMMWLMSFFMGLSMAGIGMGVMHDAAHSSFSKKSRVNKLLSFTLNLGGGHYLNWKIQYNVIHHTFTNIHRHDEDIDVPFFLRFEPHSVRRFIHRFQFIYAWFFYGLLTLNWILIKDFIQIFRYNNIGHLKASNTNLKKELGVIVITKMFYFSYMLLPYFLISDLKFWQWIVGFLTLHFTAGFILSVVFQMAHVVTETGFPVSSDGQNMDNDWATHQLHTTMNFGTKNRLLTWLTGGLNHQVEHHLFPTISHIHYSKLSKIVKQTAHEFGLPYLEKETF
ncbi:MAG: acyl-CoA desaturase [Bacteroidia bacterium]|nr:acyl-CoA desaturase [Bacteroidia bacterium]